MTTTWSAVVTGPAAEELQPHTGWNPGVLDLEFPLFEHRTGDVPAQVPVEQEAAERAEKWRVPLLGWIPIPGQAAERDWDFAPKEARKEAGRNHPRVGGWLLDRYCPEPRVCYDPMVGAGGLWALGQGRVKRLHGLEVEPRLVELTTDALLPIYGGDLRVQLGDARTHEPDELIDLTLFSAPFRSAHGSGNSKGQTAWREQRNSWAIQGFRKSPGNLGHLAVTAKAEELSEVDGGQDHLTLEKRRFMAYWSGMFDVYRATYRASRLGGVMLSVVRDYVRKGQEVGDVYRHLYSIQAGGWDLIGLLARVVYPTLGMCKRVKENPQTPHNRIEWVVVSRKEA